jgi:hypothetical protein
MVDRRSRRCSDRAPGLAVGFWRFWVDDLVEYTVYRQPSLDAASYNASNERLVAEIPFRKGCSHTRTRHDHCGQASYALLDFPFDRRH